MNHTYFIIAENFLDESSLKYYLGTNENFKQFWFKIGSNLGFHDYAVSFASPYGREIQLQVAGDNLTLKRQRIDTTRLHVTFSNFKFTLNPQSILIGKTTEKNMETKEILLSNYLNHSEVSEDIVKTLKLTKSTTTTLSSSHKIATSVGLDATTEYSFPMYGDKREVKFIFSYDYTMGNQKEQSETTQIWDEASFTVPPKSKTHLKLIVYTSSGTAEFTALANISFNVHFRGWISYDDNVYKDQTVINPRKVKHAYRAFTASFGNEEISALDDIRTQIANRHNPNSKSVWDWDKFLSKNDVKRNIIPYLNKDVAAKFNGKFDNIDSTNIVVEFAPSEPL